jgi:hypothetical protein
MEDQYQETPVQTEAINRLVKQGFYVNNKLADGTALMMRKPTHYCTEYREVDREGNVN